MHYILPNDRNQYELSSLEDTISSDNPVRYIDALVNKAYPEILKAVGSEIMGKGTSELGRRSYDPSSMLKLLIYGCMNRISSSRRLEQECHRNQEVMWLMGRLQPDFKTICNYRRDYGALIPELLNWYNRWLRDEGWIRGQLVALDGSKIKANARRKMWTTKKLQAEIDQTMQTLKTYLVLLESNDLHDSESDGQAAPLPNTSDSIQAEIKRHEERLNCLQGLLLRMQTTGQSRISETDLEARPMKTSEGIVPGYNLQVTVDAENHLLTTATVLDASTDFTGLPEALSAWNQTLGQLPENLIADCGFANPETIQEIVSQGMTEVTVPLLPSQHGDKIEFTYDQETDSFLCSEGRRLVRRGTQKRRKLTVYRYQGIDCAGCPRRNECTKSRHGRVYYRSENESWREDYIKRVAQADRQALLRQRKGLIENVFGTLKIWMGKIPLLHRGRKRITQELSLWCLVYNIRRYLKIVYSVAGPTVGAALARSHPTAGSFGPKRIIVWFNDGYSRFSQVRVLNIDLVGLL